jgi:parvulin-like peptidyl-prolyl isomerase
MIPVNQLPPELQAPVSKLKAGEISLPILSQYGVHIFRVNSRQVQSFEQVKPMLQQRAQKTTVKDAVDRLEKGARVDYDPKFFPPEAKSKPPRS